MSLRERTTAIRTRNDAVPLALAAVAVLSLALRFYDLGGRIFHWDEGRVGYWTLRYADSGQFAFAPIIHGPFLPITNEYVFALVGASDATARLVVALVGGLLPLSAWLFRRHLRGDELLALALVFALNPILLYYSRFMRNDVLVATFSVFALGFFVRAYDARRVGFAYLGAASLALAFTTKGNAVLYVACYLGGLALVADHALVRSTAEGRTLREILLGAYGDARRGLSRASGETNTLLWVGIHLAGLAVTFLAVLVFYYAPRPELWEAVARPALLPGVVHEATVGSAERMLDLWGGGMQEHDYLPYLQGLLTALVYGAPVVLVFALVGFAADGYGGRPSRWLVSFGFYWGLASVVGYPVATDIRAAWTAVHVVVPLAFPAAVGLAWLARTGVAAYDREDAINAAVAALLVLSVVVGVAATNATYWNSTEADHREVVQWAQPHNDIRESLDDVERVAVERGSVEVRFVGTEHSRYGTRLYVEDESTTRQRPAGGPAWHSRLPVPWYLERIDQRSDAAVETTSVPPEADAREAFEGSPEVVIAHHWDRGCEGDGTRCLDEAAEENGYVAIGEHGARLWSLRLVFYVDADAAAAADIDVDAAE